MSRICGCDQSSRLPSRLLVAEQHDSRRVSCYVHLCATRLLDRANRFVALADHRRDCIGGALNGFKQVGGGQLRHHHRVCPADRLSRALNVHQSRTMFGGGGGGGGKWPRLALQNTAGFTGKLGSVVGSARGGGLVLVLVRFGGGLVLVLVLVRFGVA